MGPEPSDRDLTGLTSDRSTALNTPEVPLSEKEGYEEAVTSPVAPTLGEDDYPDGGFTAWCVLLGVSQSNNLLVFSNFLMDVWSCRLRVLFSQRKLHSTSLVANTRLTSEDSLSFGLAGSWGVREFQILPLDDVSAQLEIGIPILLRTGSHTRDPNLDNVSPEFFTLSVRLI